MHPYNPQPPSGASYTRVPQPDRREPFASIAHFPSYNALNAPLPTSLTPGAPSHPASLQPGNRPRTQYQPDLFFQEQQFPATAPPTQSTYRSQQLMNSPSPEDRAALPSRQSHRSYVAPPPKPRPPHRSSAPVLPPKIPIYPEPPPPPPSLRPHSGYFSSNHVSGSNPSAPTSPIPPNPSTSTITPAHGTSEKRQSLNQEEEDLAKALHESVLMGGGSVHDFITAEAERYPPSGLNAFPTAGSSRTSPSRSPDVYSSAPSSPVATSSATTSPALASPPRSNPLTIPEEEPIVTLSLPVDYLAQMEADEAFARQLAAEDEEMNAHPNQDEDEALARRLAQEEESEQSNGEKASQADDGLPRYADITSPTSSSLVSSSKSHPRPTSLPSSEADAALLRSNSIQSSSSSSQYSSSVQTPSSSEHSHSAASHQPQAPALPNKWRSANGRAEDSPRLAGQPVNANQFVDAELLAGVSLNFVAPVISTVFPPMKGPLPNIISLPYGRCPPLHIQAPNWRHLLKLLARLSATRIEPTIEAVAVTKNELKLRIVVQFVRTHHQSSDWRTVLWLTIDHPVPPAMPGAYRYTNGDVNVLPFSYTLSSVPALLRDGSDSYMSKAYTVPITANTPYPTLPITFPSLAMYLQAVLDESRRYINDSSSGVRNLAKTIDFCYPSKPGESSYYPSETPTNQGGVGGLIKKAFGRGARTKKTLRSLNEDTYEFITPFVPDEWGT